MHRWLIGGEKVIEEIESLPDTITDEQLRALSNGDWTAEQLACTPQGQVRLMPGERSVFEFNASTASALKKARAAVWNALPPAAKRERVRQTIGARPPDRSRIPQVETVGTVARDNCTILKLVLAGETGIRLPALAFVPTRPTGSATLYLHGASMTEDASPGGPIDALVRQGHLVLAAELRGIGETETGRGRSEFGRGRFGPDNLEIFTAYLMGVNFVGLRVEDIQAWTRVLRESRLAGASPADMHLVAIGEAAIPALHAVALAGDEFCTVTLRRMVRSWEDVVRAPENYNQTVNVVHGVLRHYDLPELAELAGQSRLRIAESVDASGNRSE